MLVFVYSQFFNQVLVMGKSSVSDLSEHVFDLIQELFAIDPMLLTSVMPQLEFKLKVNTTLTSKITNNTTLHTFCFCVLDVKLWILNYLGCFNKISAHFS